MTLSVAMRYGAGMPNTPHPPTYTISLTGESGTQYPVHAWQGIDIDTFVDVFKDLMGFNETYVRTDVLPRLDDGDARLFDPTNRFGGVRIRVQQRRA